MDVFTQTSCSRCTSASGRTLLEEALEKFSDRHSSQNSVNPMQVTVTHSKSSFEPSELLPKSKTMLELESWSSRNERSSKSSGLGSTGNMKRSKTSILSTPARHCDACAMEHIRTWRKAHSGTCLSDSNLMIQQSPCDLHASESEQCLRPTTATMFTGDVHGPPVFMVKDRPQTASSQHEVFLPLATVPKKGMIKLTSLEYEHILPDEQTHRREKRVGSQKRSLQQRKSLISRKDILDQVRIGTLRLEEEERRKAMEFNFNKTVQNYTFGDLQETVIKYANDIGRKSALSRKQLQLSANNMHLYQE